MSNALLSSTEYLADREALLIQADLSGYLIDYYLHRRQTAAHLTPEHDAALKELIACFAIHLTIRASAESHAWTVHMVAENPYSLFVTGQLGPLRESGAADGYLVGNVLTDHIRHTDVNSFHAQLTDPRGRSRKSFVKCESSDIPRMVEHFYEQSEQQSLRIQHSESSDRVTGLLALPDHDRAWFESVSLEELRDDGGEPRKLMRTCTFRFACDCSPTKLLPFFRSLSPEGVDELYGHDDELTIVCPRCGRAFSVSRSDVGMS